jgi:ubiquinone/menaquinone biosynthesis C-methylase UbiE
MSASPVPRHESDRAFYDRISDAYDLLADSNEKAARQAGVQALELKPGERVVEIGFGTGNEVLDLAERVGASGRVAGIDVSSGMLAVAQRKIAQKKPQAPIDLRVGDARKLPFDDGAFDAAYSSFTLELFADEDIPVVLAEVKRVLKPGGRIGVVSMAEVKAGQKASALEKTYIWMHRHFPHIVDCRPIDLAGLVSAAGYRIARNTELAIWTMPVAVVVAMKA